MTRNELPSARVLVGAAIDSYGRGGSALRGSRLESEVSIGAHPVERHQGGILGEDKIVAVFFSAV